MRSIVWNGDRAPTQAWGWTTVTAEPWYVTPTFSGYYHCGIDIPGSTGDTLRAARAGRVLAVGTGFLAIAVGGEADWYLHGTYVVSTGQQVAYGQVIGAIGNIAPPGGASFGAHLHFERQSTLRVTCNYPATSLNPVTVLEEDMPQFIRNLGPNPVGAIGEKGSTGKRHLNITEWNWQSITNHYAYQDVNQAQWDAIPDVGTFALSAADELLLQQAHDTIAGVAAAIAAAPAPTGLTAAQAQELQEAHDAVQKLTLTGALTPTQDANLQAAKDVLARVETSLKAA
jgi:hypothetical protein